MRQFRIVKKGTRRNRVSFALILRCEHNRHDPCCFLQVGRIVGMVLQAWIVIIDLEHDLVSLPIEQGAVMFTMRVILLGKVIEVGDSGNDGRDIRFAEGGNTCAQHYLAIFVGLPQLIIEPADFFCLR